MEYEVKLNINGGIKTFTLIDTPGFEDLSEENLLALGKIAEKLREIRPRVVYGAIYFHRIINGRFHGTARFVLSIFKSICGQKFFPHVAFVTTMWDAISEEDYERHNALNDDLEAKYMRLSDDSPGIFKRLHDNEESSVAVLKHFVELSTRRPTPPQLQLIKEIGSGRRINTQSTTAGREMIKRGQNMGKPGCCVVL